MTDSRVLLDTSAWLSHLDSTDNGQVRAIVLSKAVIYVSVLSLFEVKRKLLKDKLSSGDVAAALDNILARCTPVELSQEICLTAAEHSVQHKLSAVDALIYATSESHLCTLITFDNDFRGLQNVKVLK